jgi:glycosyltransferase involved in cell wall biosynthesis
MKIIISQGQGKLHINETASALKNENATILYITGWLPKKLPSTLVNGIGRLIGRKELYRLLMLRQPLNLSDSEIATCSLAEFWYWFLVLLSKTKIITYDNAITKGWLYWGAATKKYLGEAAIFHVRSGAGQGGAIKKAKKNGMLIIADYSMAHPIAIEKYLKPEYDKFNRRLMITPDTKFCSVIIKDCYDADYILANSDFVKETLVENGFAREKIKVIYLGVRKDFFYIKDNWEIKDKTTRLLFTGVFSLLKGARIMIEAIRLLNKRNCAVILDIVGRPEDFEALARAYSIPSNINFHGSVIQDDLKSFLSDSDLYIFPTFVEGCARSAMEAMAAGLPVITTHNCGVPIVHNETGIIIPINNPEALANEVQRLISNKALRESVGKNAASLVANNYTWSDYGKQLMEFYKEIVP